MDLRLESRPGLPDALRVLLRDHPREGWEADPNFAGLTSLWLNMHLHFRQSLGAMRAEAEALLDGRMDPGAWAPRLARMGGGFVQHLHGHHGIEDDHYFPLLARRDARLERGFALLDADHQALDGHLDGFVADAEAALAAARGVELGARAGRLRDGLVRLEGFLDRHLTDEEELVVPILLRDGEAGLHGR